MDEMDHEYKSDTHTPLTQNWRGVFNNELPIDMVGHHQSSWDGNATRGRCTLCGCSPL